MNILVLREIDWPALMNGLIISYLSQFSTGELALLAGIPGDHYSAHGRDEITEIERKTRLVSAEFITGYRRREQEAVHRILGMMRKEKTHV